MNRRSLLALLATTTLAGCNGATRAQGEADVTAPTDGWTQFRGGPQRRGRTTREYSFGQQPPIHETERVSVTSPVLDGDTAIIPSESSLVGLDLQTLTVEYDVGLESVPTLPPAQCSSVVAVQTSDNVRGYDLESRTRVWNLSAQTTHVASSAPAALGNHFVLQDGNRLRLVEHESGSVVWSREFDARLDGFAANEEVLVVNRNTGDESEILALDPSNGETRWSVTVESSRLHPVVGPFVFALSEYGRLIAIENGDVQWTVETGVQKPEPMAVTDEIAVVASEPTSQCVGVAIGDGSVAWRSALDFGGPVLAGSDRALVAGANSGIVEFDVTSGKRLRAHEDARFADSLVPTSRGLLYTNSSNDRVSLVGET